MSDTSNASRRFYRGLHFFASGLFRLWHRLEVHGREKVPASGGFILCPGGHRSILDTPLAANATTRMLRYMGAEKYFDVPGLGWFLRSAGGFPVERGMADREALRISENILRQGDPLVVYPESTRFTGPIVQPFKEGAAFLACRTGVPLVPVGMGGAERAFPIGARFLKPTKLALVVGDPIFPPAREEGARVKRSEVRALNEQLHEAVQACFDEAQIRASVK